MNTTIVSKKKKEFKHNQSLFPQKILKWHRDAKPEVYQKTNFDS